MSLYKKLKRIESGLRRLIRRNKQRPSRFERFQTKFYQHYPNYSVGIGTYGIPEVHDWNEGTTLVIGSYCSISSNVQIFLGGHHRVDWVSTYPFSAYLEGAKPIPGTGFGKGDVIIGSDVWLCANATILSGVTIGHGAVVANSAVVTKNVEPYSIVAGNPARLISYRFDEETRFRLLQSQWWDWDLDEVKVIHALLSSDKLNEFWRYLDEREVNKA